MGDFVFTPQGGLLGFGPVEANIAHNGEGLFTRKPKASRTPAAAAWVGTGGVAVGR